ncbi:50S ribosomal protein L24 [Candidatus Micrarchaeota archaeon]|nr:50S ribosomal protein L24 [Candidatus Micrarchaeota archaeon]
MAVCSFCGNEIKPGTGVRFVRKDGKSFSYCSSKCQKNTKLGREGRRKKWTKAYVDFKKATGGTAKKKSSKKKKKKR